MIRRRMVSLALGCVCAALALAGSGHAGWAPQKAQAVASMNGLDLPALKKPITKRFVNTKLSEVLAWLSLEQFSFVADSSEFPGESSVTLNFRSQPLGAVLDAIADAFNGRWERKGEIFMLRPTAARGLGGIRSPFAPVGAESRPETVAPGVASTVPRIAELAPAPQGAATAPSGVLVPAEVGRPTAPGVISRSRGPGAAAIPGVSAPAEIARAQSLAPLARLRSPGAATMPVPAERFVTSPALIPNITRAIQSAPLAMPPGASAPLVPARVAEAIRGVATAPPLAVTSPAPITRGLQGGTTIIQDSKAHQEAMKEVERALKLAESEMKKLHESGEWKRAMEKAMAEARAVQGDEHKKAMDEARKAMAEAHKAMQNLPNSSEWKQAWENARQEIRKALKEGKVVENGKERKMTDKERQALEKTLKNFETIKMPDLKLDFKGLDKMQLEGLEKMKFIHPDHMKGLQMSPKTFVMPKIDSKVFAMPKDFKGRVFTMPSDDPEFKARNQQIQKHIEEMNERLKEMGIEGMKGHTFAMPKLDGKSFTFTTPKGDSKLFTVPPMKMEELKGLERVRPFMLDSRKMRIGELLGSLTASQKEKQEKQGYLTLADLTPKQRELLGSVPEEGNWTFSYSIDGKKLTIKNK